MRNSRRIKRMSRNRVKLTKMNLTSLMDIFTILVFFLLINSGSVEILETPKNVTLPESRVEAKPRETVMIFVSQEEVLVQGELVALVADILGGKRAALDPIKSRLAQLRENIIGPSIGCRLLRTCLRIQPVYPLDVGAGDKVAVGIHRDVDGTVSHLLLDVGDRSAILDEEATKGVPQFVKANLPQPCSFNARSQLRDTDGSSAS